MTAEEWTAERARIKARWPNGRSDGGATVVVFAARDQAQIDAAMIAFRDAKRGFLAACGAAGRQLLSSVPTHTEYENSVLELRDDVPDPDAECHSPVDADGAPFAAQNADYWKAFHAPGKRERARLGRMLETPIECPLRRSTIVITRWLPASVTKHQLAAGAEPHSVAKYSCYGEWIDGCEVVLVSLDADAYAAVAASVGSEEDGAFSGGVVHRTGTLAEVARRVAERV